MKNTVALPKLANKIIFAGVCLLAVGFAVLFITQMLAATKIKLISNLAYVDHPSTAQKLDLYLPEDGHISTKRPLVIYIHGGAWRAGDKQDTPAPLLAYLGYVVASINYRLTGEATFPAQLEDCLAAIEWLNKHSEEYGIDRNRIGIWGESAGGHLAVLTALMINMRTDRTKAADIESPKDLSKHKRIVAVCDWCGPTDFLTILSQYKSDDPLHEWSATGPIAKLLGGPPHEVPEVARAASPISWVRTGAPAFLIVHGDHDVLVPIEQSKELAEKLKQAHIPVQFHVAKGIGHHVISKETLNEAVEFFEKHLSPGSSILSKMLTAQ
jgi:acetyl esterase/lipase